MKRGNKLLLMAGALVVVCGAAAVAAKLNPDNQEETEDTGTSIFQLDADSAESLSWTQGDETVSLVMEDSTWKDADDADFPVNQSIPESMTETLSDVLATKTIEDVDDLSEYGLDEPSCTVTVKAGDTESTLLISDETGLGGSRYLSLDEGTTVYLVDSSLYDSFSYGLYDIVQTEEIPAMNDVTSFTVESENGTLTLTATESVVEESSDETESAEDAESTEEDEEEETETVWTSGSETLDSSKAEDLVSAVTGLSWNSCVDTHASEKLADYGLDAPVKVTVEYTEDEETSTFSLEIGSTTDDGCYARLADSELVYLIDADVRETLTSATVDSLLPEEEETTAEEEETAAEETSGTSETTSAEETAEAETAETDSTAETAESAETASAAETTETAETTSAE